MCLTRGIGLLFAEATEGSVWVCGCVGVGVCVGCWVLGRQGSEQRVDRHRRPYSSGRTHLNFCPCCNKRPLFAKTANPERMFRPPHPWIHGRRNEHSLKTFIIASFSGFTGMPSVYPRARHPSETANWRFLRKN